MTLARRLEHRCVWHCDICGQEDIWQDSWSYYGSYAHEEACPYDLPNACSDECRVRLEKKIEDGIFVLPKLKRDPGGFTVVKERKGY